MPKGKYGLEIGAMLPKCHRRRLQAFSSFARNACTGAHFPVDAGRLLAYLEGHETERMALAISPLQERVVVAASEDLDPSDCALQIENSAVSPLTRRDSVAQRWTWSAIALNSRDF